jgi:hypothetical protein
MYSDTLLSNLIIEPDPAPTIVNHLLTQLEPLVDLNDIGSTYEAVEERLRDFEEWLHVTWGKGFYDILVTGEDEWALTKAFRTATEKKTNVLICDGFSIRELLVLSCRYGADLSYMVGRAPAPTTTENTARRFFQVGNLKDAFKAERLIEGNKWKGIVIEDLNKPPRLGSETGYMLLTQFPDSPLHNAVAHRTTQIQDVSNVISEVVDLINHLSKNTPLTVTGDHGYIFLGPNPQRNLWDPYSRVERFGGNYGEKGMVVDSVSVAVGRFHANTGPGSNTFITHGGVSLTESLVPVVTIDVGVEH